MENMKINKEAKGNIMDLIREEQYKNHIIRVLSDGEKYEVVVFSNKKFVKKYSVDLVELIDVAIDTAKEEIDIKYKK